MLTLENCLREAELAEDLAQLISLDTHRTRMFQIATEWRRDAELIAARSMPGCPASYTGSEPF